MSKIINHPIHITTGESGEPQAFTWGNKRFHVAQILEKWVEAGEWWDGATELHVYRVLTEPHGLYEMHFYAPPDFSQETGSSPEAEHSGFTGEKNRRGRHVSEGILYRVYD